MRAMMGLLALAFLGLGFRLVDLQVLRHDRLSKLAKDYTQRTYFFKPHRGDIRDRRGNLLATSVPVKTICANPTLIKNAWGDYGDEVGQVLAPLLSLNQADLVQRLQPRYQLNEQGLVVTNTNGIPVMNRYVVLKRKVSVEQWLQVTQAMFQLATQALAQAAAKNQGRKLKSAEQNYYTGLGSKAICAEDDQQRVYPQQRLASHVLGHVGAEERQAGGRDYLGMIGKDGVELTLNPALVGVPGWRRTEIDKKQREVVAHRDQDVAPRNGLNVVLTLDARIQEMAEEVLEEATQKHHPISASAIVMEPRTGSILAMATLPNFNPNQPGLSPMDALRNRVVTDLAEPGSTFKIVVVTGALNEGLVRLEDVFDCEQGLFHFHGKPLRDHERYGNLTVEQIITKSSNIGAAKIGIKMGPDLLRRYIRQFGFGERSGIPLVGERLGTVKMLKDWDKLSISRIPMGHEVDVTPLQMVMAMGAIANGGMLMRPMLIDRVEDEQGRTVAKYQPQAARRVCREETARLMVRALKTVVATNGTASKARLENYVVAGKTGTAQKAIGGVYVPDKFFSSFIGFFPADRPELCILVVLDEPERKLGYYGGQIAAPIFAALAERAANYLGIQPDRATEDSPLTSGMTNKLAAAKTNFN
jgi:cell division protein FtsI/penicillin-binding protein 2